MNAYSFYDPATGAFSGEHIAVPDRFIDMNTPAGMVAIKGRFNPLSHRVNLDTGAVESWQPSPDAIAAQQRQAAKTAARAEIARLEASQGRAVREALIGMDGARERLRSIDAAISAARAVING